MSEEEDDGASGRSDIDLDVDEDVDEDVGCSSGGQTVIRTPLEVYCLPSDVIVAGLMV